MKKHRRFFNSLLFVMCVAASSCSSTMPGEEELEVPPEEDLPVKLVDKIMMSANDFIVSSDFDSRSNITLQGNKLVFTWNEKDKVGIVPMEGSQIYFTVKSGAGTKIAKFDGGAWGLKADATYAAYTPYRTANNDRPKWDIIFSYEGQKQIGNASLAHMGDYDLMAANHISSVNNELLFQFEHLNSIVRFRLNVPSVDNFSTMKLSCFNPIFPRTVRLDFSNPEVRFSTRDKSTNLEMALEDVASTNTDKELLVYMMLPPIDMTLENVDILLYSKTNRVYQGTLPRKRIVSGHAYDFRVNLTDVTLSTDVDSPNFGADDVEI